MALRNAASVANVVTRRGTGALGVNDFIWLQENSKEVKKVTALLDKHIKTLRDDRQEAVKAEAAASARLAEVAEAETALDTRQAEHDETVEASARKLEADLDALIRRSNVVTTQETESGTRSAAIDGREARMNARDLASETEMRTREEAVEARESAVDEREQVQQATAADLAKRASTITTAAQMLKQAAATLR